MDGCDSGTVAATEYFWDVLKTVYDPEIGVNVVDLGLIYAVDLRDGGDGKFDVSVDMTLTTPWCPLADVIGEGVKSAISNTEKCSNVSINFTFDPPWNADMITAEGKMQLGLL
jgi:metal-sulfur cluster biosynthetic enzyme